jgi:chemotaxis protein CheX
MSTVDRGTVEAVVEQVWESLLAQPVVPWTGAPDAEVDDALRAEVTLRGDWTGHVRLTCDATTARSLARAMLVVPQGDPVADADVLDAVGEVANVIGGNIKGTLAGTTSLGLPEVAPAALGSVDPRAVRYLVRWHASPVVVDVAVHATVPVPPTTPV